MSASLPPTLPAIAVVLGLPLCRHNNNNTTVHHTNDDAPSSHHQDDNTNDDDTKQHQLLFNQRVKNNVARIYARRVINRARLERDHPYSHHRHNNNTHNTRDNIDGSDSTSSSSSRQHNQQRSLTTLSSQDNSSNGSSSSSINTWKDELLSETLVSLIQLQDRITKVKSFTTTDNTKSSIVNTLLCNNNNNQNKGGLLLDQLLGISTSTTIINSINSNLPFGFNFNNFNSLAVATAQCEAKAITTPSKVKEWSNDIDLVQRRLEFGKEISPLSNTTRVQRWSMACKRIVTLSMLAAPLCVMIPTNFVLGKIAGSNKKGKKKLVLPDDYDGSVVAAVKGEASSSSSSTTKQQPEQQQKQQQLSIMQKYHSSVTKATWNYALWAIESAGPTYIKLVQWASTRNDLFSPEFIGHFSKLQDETRGHTWKETERTLIRAYGTNWKNVLSFDKIIDDGEDDYDDMDSVEGLRLKRKGGHENRERQKRLLALNEAPTTDKKGSTTKTKSTNKSPTIPIGSGCVAQVYKARLTKHHGVHPPGTSVAVKVQHPHILEKVCLDFYIFNKLASALEYIPYLNLDYLSMKDSVDQFRDIMLPQLDLRVEAHNLRRFRRDFEGESQISFPEPFMGLTSREVLVERFVEGEPMLNYVLKEDELHTKKDREELATIGLETVMKMIFLHDFVHADLHPGNMIVDHNKSVRGNPLRMHMIDCGLTVELGERDHMNLTKILGSLIKRDGYGAGALMVDTAKKCQATELDVEMFCKGMQNICDDDEENNFLESVGDYITDICYLACKHKVKLEAAFINAALACEIMEGLASSLYPDMAVQRIALPMVLKAEMMHGMKGLPSPLDWASDVRKNW